jgi:hypothetical protein
VIGPQDERVHTAVGERFSDSVSFSFGDAGAGLYGLARIGLDPDAGRASALAVLFDGGEPAAAVVRGGLEVEATTWESVEAAGVRVATLEPLARWEVALEGRDGGFDLRFEAASPPLEHGEADAAGAASGMAGYEQMCRVEGTAGGAGRARRVDCLGQRGHGWGAAPWDRIDLARTVSAWFDGPRGVLLSAVRPAGAAAHGDEAVTAFVVEPAPEGAVAAEVADPRLSTTYDGEGRQRRAGLELWVGDEDDLPRRAAGEVACGTTLELGDLRLDCAFFRWRMDGREGAGRYDVLRRS